MSETRDDRDDLTPAPDAPVSASERAQAESFAGHVDAMLAGEPLPPAMSSDERALLEVATAVHAAHRDAPLDEARRRALIDDVPGQGAGAARPATAEPGAADGATVTPIGPRLRGRVWRGLPWSVAVAAAAAALVLALGRPATPPQPAPAAVAEAPVPAHLTSRPADALIGRIPRADAGDASARIDAIYADRMSGYRSLRLRGIQ
jgi:hypothetical protein